MSGERPADDIPESDARRVAIRYLVIVARDRPELVESLTRQFADDPTTLVVVDRRVDDRRERDRSGEDEAMPPRGRPERRVGDRRRSTFQVVAKLWLAGYVIVRID